SGLCARDEPAARAFTWISAQIADGGRLDQRTRVLIARDRDQAVERVRRVPPRAGERLRAGDELRAASIRPPVAQRVDRPGGALVAMAFVARVGNAERDG